MKQKIYFIGSDNLKDKLSKGVALLGWSLTDFVGWQVKDLILYEINNVDTHLFHIPKNLLVITNNIKLKDTGNPNIFYYQNNDLKFSFPKFLLSHQNKKIEKSVDFYENLEEIRILYFRHTKGLKELLEKLSKSKRYSFKEYKFSKCLTDEPTRTLLYTEEFRENIKIPTIYNGLSPSQKKELKKFNPLVPKIFINKINNTTYRKVINFLN